MGALGVSSGRSNPTYGYAGMPTKAPEHSDKGITLGESTIMHVGLGLEAGYDSNIFYRKTDVKGAGIIRVAPFVEFTNAGRGGIKPSGAFYDLSLSLTYRDYLTSDSAIRNYRAWMPSANGVVEFHSDQQLSLSLGDAFMRLEDAPYGALNLGVGAPQESIKRDTNTAYAQLRWAPGGGRLQTTLRYSNTIDFFETDYLKFANSMWNAFMLDVAWKWLPKTAVYVRSDVGYISYFNERPTSTGGTATKPSSLPLRAVAGLRGLITEKLSLDLSLGYMTAFYSSGPSPSGFLGSFAAAAELTYRPTILSSITLGYRHEFYNSVVSNFFYSETAYASFRQLVAGNFSMAVSGRYEHRTYKGFTLASGGDRIDDFIQLGANFDYAFQQWAFAGVGYSLLANGSNYDAAQVGNVGYTKHQVFARLGITY